MPSPQFLFPLAAVVAGYLLGSISFAVIVARHCGVDILKEGSGNPGATNVKRVCGRAPGNLVFALDVFKGALAAGWPRLLVAFSIAGEDVHWVLYAQLAGLVGAVLGHCFSVFLHFKGGKGVAVSAGALFGAMPECFVVAGLVWVLAFLLARFVSVASLLGGLSLPMVAAWRWGTGDVRFWLGVFIALFFIFTHRTNIVRLFRGEEHRFSRKH
ncbi:MAG: glycerol-3-phosphate 1-O-acyltransferase PlsY [Puniceicoccales bacterium]|jgi:glycerol-3-phosphate acyltransferase PlsY|nr:glycerol-3-phosphate 1-O-acyltransferase PlsY [Puniceicoccales bacterium]